jgi:hypothetical protein
MAQAQNLPPDPRTPYQKARATRQITSQEVVAILAERERAPNIVAAFNGQRTDRQIGASSDAPRSTSILEKPGIADLLALSIDRGAITKTAAGTGLTLSTTPYAFATGFGLSDSPTAFDSAPGRLARNISLSSTFSSTDVTSGDFSSFSSGEVKYVAIGNHSPRDGDFIDGIRGSLAKAFLDADKNFEAHCKDVITKLRAAASDLTITQATAIIDKALSGVSTTVTPGCRAAQLASENSIGGALAVLDKATKAYLADKSKQLSFAASFVRDATLSDYYTGKVLFAYDHADWTTNVNGSSSWNRHSLAPNGTTKLRSVREYSLELGANSKTINNIDYSASAKWSRDKAADAKSAIIGEAKATIHIATTYSLPVSLTFSNRGTTKVKKGWQLNVGLGAFLDDVLKAAGKR